MLGLCKNGHLTGQRHCGQCGADRHQKLKGEGRVTIPRHELRAYATKYLNGKIPFSETRQGHRFGSKGGGHAFHPMTRSLMPMVIKLVSKAIN